MSKSAISGLYGNFILLLFKNSLWACFKISFFNIISKILNNKWWHGKGPLKISCRLAFPSYRPRNSRLEDWTDPKKSQVTEWSVQGKPGQEIASVLPFNALFLSHCTSEITNGNGQRWGVSHHRRKDMIFLALGDVVSSHPTIRPWHGPTQCGLVWLLHSKRETASRCGRVIRDSKVWFPRVCVESGNSNALWPQQTNPLQQAPRGYAAAG